MGQTQSHVHEFDHEITYVYPFFYHKHHSRIMSKNQENKFPEFSVTIKLHFFGMLDESTFESS